MNIAVFCSASERIDEKYFNAAVRLGEWMAGEGHTLVFGGSNQGLMRCIFDSLHAKGGECIGVLPEKFEEGGRAIPDMDVLIHTPNIAERKETMLDHSDVAVIMPGGIGTVDELFSTLVNIALGYHDVKVVIYNIDGYWDKLLALFEDMRDRGTMHKQLDELFSVATSHDELTGILTQCK